MATYDIGTVWDKTQRWLRTALQVAIPAFFTFNVVLPQIIIALDGILAPEVFLWLNGIAAGVTGIAAALSRIMAIPQVNEFLARFGLATVPKELAKVE